MHIQSVFSQAFIKYKLERFESSDAPKTVSEKEIRRSENRNVLYGRRPKNLYSVIFPFEI